MANTNFTVNVKVQDTELFKDLSEIVITALNDERIPMNLREEYRSKIKDCFALYQVDEDAK